MNEVYRSHPSPPPRGEAGEERQIHSQIWEERSKGIRLIGDWTVGFLRAPKLAEEYVTGF